MECRHPRILVTEGIQSASLPAAIQIHHRDYPEIWAEGADAREAAIQLANHFCRALESAASMRRRDPLQKALSEVESYLDALCLEPESTETATPER